MEEDRRHAGFLIRMPMYNGSEGKARLCRILGDEAGGIVLERVRLIWHQAIMSEASNMCDLFRISTDRGVMLSDGKSRFSVDGKPVLHFVGTFMFREYTIMHLGWVAKILAPLDKICVPRLLLK
ncbi:alcohol dehydrogenase 1-like isoform X2 [Daucus carota subsp. sativus]|uniref:alcohol dehydrogenase 1-like isoform X2 n=1 Tax=Daucus carota subsp. sativus TaxID=79200 RepID=UPI0030828DD2